MDALARGRDLIRIGGLAVVAIIIFVTMFLWLTDRGITADNSTLFIRFDSAERLKNGDPVLFRGVPVGSVQELQFAAGGVLVRARLDRDVPAAADATARLQAVDVFGAQSVVLRDGSASAPPLADGDTIAGEAGTDLMGRVGQLSDRAAELLTPRTVDRVQTSLDNIAAASAELQRTLSEARALMGDQAEELSATMSNMAALTANLRDVTDPAELETTLANLEAASARLVDLTEGLDRATGSLESVLAKVDTGQGTAGRLVNDPALYDRLVVTTDNLDALIRDILENPGRYISVSVF
ncbi:MAG: MlaD family protein [Candidatus Longimicrobiales bacterium M2_2A_002]